MKYFENSITALYFVAFIASVIHLIYYFDEKNILKTTLAIIASIIFLILLFKQAKKASGTELI
jgi:hypothetical protein